jgi:hypothetical protein
MPVQVWNLFDGLPGVPPQVPLGNPFLRSQASVGWGGARVVSPAAYGLAGLDGLGTVNPASLVQSSGAIAEVAIGGAVKAGALGPAWATAAIPIIGAAVVGVTLAITLIMSRKGPKQKTATTTIVNDIEPQLEANVQGYINGPRTPESQMQALENFKAGWQAVLDNCGDPSMGRPGQNCIAERQEGARPQWDACKNAPGGCPNWFELYRDPILAHPPLTTAAAGNSGTVTNPSNGGGSVTGPGSGSVTEQINQVLSGGSSLPLLLLAGLAVYLVSE